MTDLIPTQLKGVNGEIVIRDVPVAVGEFTLDAKTSEVSQDVVGLAFPRTSPGTTKMNFKMTNIDISGEQMAMAMATDAVASTRTVLSSCDASANPTWAVTGANAANSAITVDTSNKKLGTGALLITNTGDASGNVVAATITPAADLSGFDLLEMWVRSDVTGANVIASAGFGEAAISEQTKAVTIRKADTFQLMAFDISAIPDASKNAVTKVGITLGSDSSANEIYIDSVIALKGVELGTPEYFDVNVKLEDLTDPTKYLRYFIPNCYFTDFSMMIPGGKDKVIEGPISGGIKDASKIKLFYSQ